MRVTSAVEYTPRSRNPKTLEDHLTAQSMTITLHISAGDTRLQPDTCSRQGSLGAPRHMARISTNR